MVAAWSAFRGVLFLKWVNEVEPILNDEAKHNDSMEHRAGIEPANTGFADQRVSHFATGALVRRSGATESWIKTSTAAAL